MWARFLSFFLSRLIKQGALVAIYADGRSKQYGEDSSSPVTVRFHARSLPRKLLVNPDLALGEAYMDGTLTIEEDDIYGLVELLVVNLAHQPDVWHYRSLARLRRLYRRLAQFNPAERARRNVAHHYDLSGALYDLFLDTDRQYSCAYFRRPEDGLEAAQENKKALIAAKLLLEPGQRVLDIGCGWGGLGLHLARDHGASVTGVTLSQEQHRIAEERARAGGLAERTRFRLQDYRQVDGTFDRIVSVGITASSSPRCATASRMTELRCCTRSAGPTDRERPIPGLQSTSFRAATALPYLKFSLLSKSPASMSPISKCGAFTMQRR